MKKRRTEEVIAAAQQMCSIKMTTTTSCWHERASERQIDVFNIHLQLHSTRSDQLQFIKYTEETRNTQPIIRSFNCGPERNAYAYRKHHTITGVHQRRTTKMKIKKKKISNEMSTYARGATIVLCSRALLSCTLQSSRTYGVHYTHTWAQRLPYVIVRVASSEYTQQNNFRTSAQFTWSAVKTERRIQPNWTVTFVPL